MSSPASSSTLSLPPLLDDLVAKGGEWLMRSRLRDALKQSVLGGALAMMTVALLTLLWALANLLWSFPAPNVMGMGAVALLGGLLVIGWRLMAVLKDHPSREESLAIFDERLQLKDRLRTADAFLRRSERDPFIEAAVADALPAAQSASERELFWDWGDWRSARSALGLAVAALACLLVSWFLPQPWTLAGGATTPEALPEELTIDAAAPVKADDGVRRPDVLEERPQAREPQTTPPPPPKGEPPSLVEPAVAKKMVADDDVKETEGLTEGGQHSDAKSSGRSDRSQGAPGNQSPASKPVEPKPTKKRKKPAKENQPPKRSSDKKVKDRSGATSGRGSSSGSSRNPASTDWSSKDRVDETEDQELSQEDEVDDEETESEARGGLQPNLRDRRPPVNRDLSIGFGNRSNPDANGRGGPGQRKKSRGVASLVLGVPVPDHVKGQVNPGRVKITQERIQPKAERSDPVPAEDRGRREDEYGTVPQRVIAPSLKGVVRDFFQRDLEREPSESEAPEATNPLF